MPFFGNIHFPLNFSRSSTEDQYSIYFVTTKFSTSPQTKENPYKKESEKVNLFKKMTRFFSLANFLSYNRLQGFGRIPSKSLPSPVQTVYAA